MEVNYLLENVTMPLIDQEKVKSWLAAVVQRYGREVGTLTYVFCDDEYILEVNKQFLQHDYYTDIITFDYSNSRRIAGDMVISLDTVRSNAQQLGADYHNELLRVIVHGVLHLCGINDKGLGEREIMEQHENDALAMLPENIF